MSGTGASHDSEFFRSLPEDGKAKLLAILKREERHAGEVIFQEGEPGETLFLVEKGAVSLKQWVVAGDFQKTLMTARGGEVFGEMSFIDGSPRSATATAEENSSLLVVARHDFNNFCTQFPTGGVLAHENLLRIVADRLRSTNLAYRDALLWGLHVSGSEQLNLHYLITQNIQVRVAVTGGGCINGTILQVEQSAAGHEIIMRDSGTGGLVMIPYHSVVTISFDVQSTQPLLHVTTKAQPKRDAWG